MARRAAALLLVLLAATACASMLSGGRDFPSPGRDTGRNGTTTQADLLRLFGEPTQAGVKDGDATWTWYYVTATGKTELSKQLEVTFGPGGVVKSHSFSSNFPEDLKALR